MSAVSFDGQVAVRDAALSRLANYAQTRRISNAMLHWDGELGSVAGVLGETADADTWVARLGLPIWMAHVLDTLGARLGAGAVAPVTAMLQALPVGRDVMPLGSLFVCKLLCDAATATPLPAELAAALDAMTGLHRQCLRGEEPTMAAWRQARQVSAQATDSAVPQPDEAGPPLNASDAKVRNVGMAIEAAAWDPRRSPTAVSEVLRQWLAVEALKADEVFGWTATEEAQVRTLLGEIHARKLANNPQDKRTVFDIMELEHPQTYSRMKTYERHGWEYGRVCAERACRLLEELAAERD